MQTASVTGRLDGEIRIENVSRVEQVMRAAEAARLSVLSDFQNRCADPTKYPVRVTIWWQLEPMDPVPIDDALKCVSIEQHVQQP